MDERDYNLSNMNSEEDGERKDAPKENESLYTDVRPVTENRYAYASYSYIDQKPERKKKEKKPKKERRPMGFFGKLVSAMAFGLVFGVCAAGSFYAVNTYVIKEDAKAAVTTEEINQLTETVADLKQAVMSGEVGTAITTQTTVVTDVTKVADKVMPSMVAVTNYGTYTSRDWFGGIHTQDTESYGSGIIIGESETEYYIATNHHVIEDAKSLSVQFCDETTADAYVKGYDSSMDIAVIAVSKDILEPATKGTIRVAEIGDSASLKMGEPAIAIGNALGYGQSVTTGVVSALGREMQIEGTTYSNLIQTSAAINPGNSGGALLNIAGEVIGINSSKVGGDTVEGMGFAIPIGEVRDIIKEFSERETRQVVDEKHRGYLGISSSDEYDLTAYGYPSGVYVAKIYEGSPAEKAGVYEGDIITKCDGQTVSGISELSNYLSFYKAGETVKLSITRREAGRFVEKELEVTLGNRDVVND